ncbi:hypothetical protein JRI60_52470 [Archangium violaceum]|uniref:hypothetical protein n=1 Tax=Archangium violaceum TaxID=83451 RepID=UPI00194EDFEF|nr:hypothetical protein [Archangium violaceum]QRN97455.1 hypothetical protein JRI60_52470 [Archangium violaceum]
MLPNVLKGWCKLASAQPDGIHAKLFRNAESALAESQLDVVLHHVRTARDGNYDAKKHLATL